MTTQSAPEPELPELPEVYRAFGELIVFCVASRKDDWTESAVIWALHAAHEAEMTWAQVAPRIVELSQDPTTSPRDLVPSQHDPLVKREGTPPPAGLFAAARAAAEAAAERAKNARIAGVA